LTDSSGNVSSSASYDSFGNSANNLTTRYGYTGREFDNFTGLHFYRARWYDGKLGKFISEDPIGFTGGDINLYGYVKNNPIRFTDPTGLIIPVPLITAGIGAGAGFVGSIFGKGLNNWKCGKSFFNGADTGDYWVDVGVATGTGAVAGALMPFGGTTLLGAASIGMGGNVIQYGASVGLGRTQFSVAGLGVSAATGALGGAAGGAFKNVAPYGSGFFSPTNAAIFKASNNAYTMSANTGLGTLARNGLGGALGNSPNPLDSCSCQ
jgi:RHS repeat-associated protein